MGYPKETFLTEMAGGAGEGGEGFTGGFCVKFADGRVGVTVRRLVDIDEIFCTVNVFVR
jgi:hypothetical protein